MDEFLELTVEHDSKSYTFPIQMYRWGYTHRMKVVIDGFPVIFEPDEEGNYRALIEELTPGSSPSIPLLSAIAKTLASL